MAYMKSKPVNGKLAPKDLIKRFESLKADRTNWEYHWQDIATFILPNRSDVTTVYAPGAKRNLVLLDSTGVLGCELLAGALHGMLTNPAGQWFGLTTGDEELDSLDAVRLWLQKTSRKLLNALNNSNFQTEVHQYYLDLVAFGTGGFDIEEDEDSDVRFGARHIKELYAAENNRGEIDEIHRCFSWDIRQIIGQFGEKVLALSRNLKNAYDKNSEEKFEIIHAIYPRNPAKVNPLNKAFISQYVLKDRECVELSEGSFRERPLLMPRWTKAAGETYGRSPGMNALPDIKTLNKMTETVLVGAQKAVDPPLQAPDDGFIMPLRTTPGGLNYYRAGSADRIEPVFNDTRIDFGFEMMRERRERIRQAFYVDQLQLQSGPQMTATEVLQRTEQQMRLLGPMLGRQQAEFLRPLIDRVFDILQKRGKIEPAPEVLAGRRIEVVYTSMIAQSQRIAETQAIEKTWQSIAPIVQIDQSVLDMFDGDKMAMISARTFNFPQEAIRTQEEIAGIREGRAKAQEAAIANQQEQQQIDGAAKLGPTVAKLESQLNQV